jgi:hypothetical protein
VIEWKLVSQAILASGMLLSLTEGSGTLKHTFTKKSDISRQPIIRGNIITRK